MVLNEVLKGCKLQTAALIRHCAASKGVGGIKQHVRKTCAALVGAQAIKTVVFDGKENLPLNRNTVKYKAVHTV
jgi:hypothetical protein